MVRIFISSSLIFSFLVDFLTCLSRYLMSNSYSSILSMGLVFFWIVLLRGVIGYSGMSSDSKALNFWSNDVNCKFYLNNLGTLIAL